MHYLTRVSRKIRCQIGQWENLCAVKRYYPGMINGSLTCQTRSDDLVSFSNVAVKFSHDSRKWDRNNPAKIIGVNFLRYIDYGSLEPAYLFHAEPRAAGQADRGAAGRSPGTTGRPAGDRL